MKGKNSRFETLVFIPALMGGFVGFAVMVFTIYPTLLTKLEYSATAEALALLVFSILFIVMFIAVGGVGAYALLGRKKLRGIEEGFSHAMEAARTKDLFISMVLHHLRTPLSGIRWVMKDLVSDDPKRREWAHSMLGHVAEENERALKAVQRLVEASQASMGRIEYHFEVRPAAELQEKIGHVARARGPHAKEKNIILEFKGEVMVGKAFVRIDEEKLVNAVQAVIENAIEYTLPGGNVWVGVKQEREGLIFEIKDTGIGISAGDVKKIFYQFYRGVEAQRLNPGGFGVGMFLAKSFVDGHNGTISVESDEGKGTTVRIWIPLYFTAKQV